VLTTHTIAALHLLVGKNYWMYVKNFGVIGIAIT
jgi:hypothetical protein